MNIVLKALSIENFKGIKSFAVGFGKKTEIKGENASGKTTIFDAVTWLLFNKNSLGVEKFDVRPLDENGKPIDFVEIYVKADFVDADTNEEFTLEKKQKQKWTKHTGDETATFTGNVNEFAVNGYPKSEKEYKAFIGNLIDEEQFKLLSSPTYFPSLPWKKQREIVMSLAVNESDLDFAKRVGGFDELIPELEKAPKTSDISEKWKRTKKELDTRHKELPVRIDEVSRQKVDYDLSALKAEKARLEATIETAKAKKDNTALKDAQNELTELEAGRLALINKANESRIAESNELSAQRAEAYTKGLSLSTDLVNAERDVRALTEKVAFYNSELTRLGDEYKATASLTMDASANVCPTCGREYPADKIADLQKHFEEDKAKKMKDLINKGNEAKRIGSDANAKLAEIQKTIDPLKKSISDLNDKVGEIDGKLAEIRTTAPMNSDIQYAEEQIALCKEKIEKLKTEEVEVVDTTNLEIDLRVVNQKIASAEANDTIDKRIEELKKEQKEVSQKISDADKMLYILDQFTKAKLESISDGINGQFELVNFKLFNTLLNGGIEETCELTQNGVPYSSLNNGMRICGGLDIIKTLSKIYGKSVFVFVDNAESVNDYKMPDMNCQTVSLVVTSDKELQINKED